ncbi:MAG: A/G-specific adenine glycosylase [Planctomycetes bacterium]|nr:A/G-specific adenine glycosylase [Planctomycetota bacterium]
MGDDTAGPCGPTIDPALRRRIRRRLLHWFQRHRRDLPWRHTRDPYHIWVSEVMLQQTQAATVVRYFEPFLQAFPTLADLAAADEQDVLRRWEGLGYYRRARHLHQAARQLAARHGNQFPDDPAALQDIPGIGRYTLGAIFSQAFDQRFPILEANSRRVLCRLFGRRDDPSRGPAQRWLWQTAETLLPRRQVGDFNQALMELGALVCTPSRPDCSACPLSEDCVARRLGRQEDIPFRAPPPAPVLVQEVAVVVYRRGRVLLVQRPAEGRWAGLWEFPHGPVGEDETHEAAGERLLPELTGVRVVLGPELLTLRHGIMHHRITLVCFEARYRSGSFRPTFYQAGCWVDPSQLASYPVSSPQRRLAQALVGQRQKRLF